MKELIKELYNEDGVFKKDILDELRKNRKEASKYLLKELKKISKDIDDNKLEYVPLVVDYACFLLAEFKCQELFPVLIDLFNKDNVENAFNFYGAGVLDKIPDVVVSVFDGNFKLLNELIENKKLDDYVRNRFLSCYTCFFVHDMVRRESLIKYLRYLIKLYDYEYDGIYNEILNIIVDAHLFEMIDDVKLLFKSDVIDYSYSGGYDNFIDNIFDYNHLKDNYEIVDSVEKYMSWWACFEKNNYSEIDLDRVTDKLIDKLSDEVKDSLKYNVKVGRNDPCPCGSGKKYKKCCLNKNDFTLSYQKYIDSSWDRYPKKNNNKDEVDFYSFFDEKYIRIDECVYKGLKRKEIPLFIKRNKDVEKQMDFKNLSDAYDLIKDVILENDFKDIDEYDDKVSIHYSLYDFFEVYTDILIDYIYVDKKKYLTKLDDIVNLFYDNFSFNDDRESILLDRCCWLYDFSNKVKEGIDFFLEKLNTYGGYKLDVYNYLFRLYLLEYDYDKAIKKIDAHIELENDKELINDMQELKFDVLEDWE